MIFDPTFVSNLILVLTGFGGAFLAALWISLVIWTYRDIRTRTRDPLVQTLATLLVAVLNLPGVLVYLILRPHRTLEEEYQRTLEEEALLQALEDLPLCPGCERRVKDDWQVCPNCHTRLKKACQECGKLMELPWNVCPFCGTPAPGARREAPPPLRARLRHRDLRRPGPRARPGAALLPGILAGPGDESIATGPGFDAPYRGRDHNAG